jgi:hypothetical protein
MKRIRPRLRYETDGNGRFDAVLSAQRAGFNLEFLEGVGKVQGVRH